MLTLIEGGFFSGGHEKIRKEIEELVMQGKRSILIVPEQQTVSAEREMTDFLPSSYPLTFEVTNFTRFANTVFRTLGGLSKESASGTKKSLVMWRTLTELLPTLEAYGAREVTVGGVSRMLAAVKEMQSLAITPSVLADAAAALEDSGDPTRDRRLVLKARDMAKIMALYKKILGERFSDGDDELLTAEKKLCECGKGFLTDTKIYIDGFTSFTEPQYKLIGALIRACDVSVSLTLPKSAEDAFEFSEIKGAHGRLVRLSAEVGTDTRLIRTDGQDFSPSFLISDTLSLLWRSVGRIDKEFLSDTESLQIFEAETPYEECDFVAQDIKKRVMGGAKYSDFGIIARSLSAYNGILDNAFLKAGIPLFLSARCDIESYEVIKLIYSAFSAVTGGYSRRDVITYAKCSLSGVDRHDVDELELYAEKWQINGSRFTDGIAWNMNPSGYTERRRPDHVEKLLRIDRTREAIIAPLTAFEDSLREAATVKDYAAALIEFLTGLGVEEKLAESESDEGTRIWRLICDSLDSLFDVLKDVECSADVFQSLLKITFSEADIGRIPAFVEQVVAGSADTARMYGKKYIYVIGANRGVFPASVEDDSYFTDKDKSALGDVGVPISKDTDIRSAREFYYFTRAISYARVGVNIVYAAKDSSYKAQPPSEAITRIYSISDGAIAPKKLDALPLSERAYTEEYALEHINRSQPDYRATSDALSKTDAAHRLRISDGKLKNVGLKLGEESINSIYGNSINMTQSRIDRFVSCPMNYFCKYNLSLDANRRVEFDSSNIGTFMHSILENFFIELKVRGKSISEISDAEKNEIIEKAAQRYTALCFEGVSETSARIKNTVRKLCRMARPIIDGLCDEFSNCEYKPTFFELKIEHNSDGFPSPAIFNTGSGKRICIFGTMDRVDTFKKGDDVYVRVVDYKTGGKDFSPKDIEAGENLQMFLYLKSVIDTESNEFREKIELGKDGKMIPAGVIYVKTGVADGSISKNEPDSAVASVKKNQERLGMILDDADSIAAMNPDFIPVKYKKDGEPDAHSKSRLYTLDGWERINETINDVMTDICDRITDGDIDALPLKKGGKAKVCEYCDFKPICRNAK